MKLEINNLEWEIEEVEKETKYFYGSCNYFENKIILEKNLSINLKRKVLAHELTRAYMYSFLLTEQETYTENEVCEFISCYGKQIWSKVDEYFFLQDLEKNKLIQVNNSKKKEK